MGYVLYYECKEASFPKVNYSFFSEYYSDINFAGSVKCINSPGKMTDSYLEFSH